MSVSYVFASEQSVSILIRPASETIQEIRYQVGPMPDKPWQSAPLSGTTLVLKDFESETEFLFLQQAVAEDTWNDTYTYRYDYLQESWSLFAPEPETTRASNTSLDVKGYGLLPTGCSSDFYSYLLGGGIQANTSLGKLLGHTGLTFSKGPPKNAWVKSQQALALAIGIGYPIPLSEKITLIPEVGYGVIFHLLDADFDKDGTYKLEFFIDQQVKLALYGTYALNERYKLFVAPLGVLFFEKDDFGIMYGCQAGLRISL